MGSITAVHRLSPRVRRLAEEHGVTLRSVAGTGTDGRVTPDDVLSAVGVPHRHPAGTVLASPAARRVLRAAGVDLDAAATADDGGPLTRSTAERIVDRGTSAAPGDAVRGTPTPHRPDVAAATVDVAELLAAVAAARTRFVKSNGFELGLEVPLAVAAVSVLARDVLSSDDQEAAAGADRAPHVGFHTADDPGHVRTVRDASHLTVAGLARRARAAAPTPVGDRDRGSTPTVTITTDHAGSVDALVEDASLCVLVLGATAPRQRRGEDHLGHEVLLTRPHVTLRLHHARALTTDDADALLRAICEVLRTWALPVGP